MDKPDTFANRPMNTRFQTLSHKLTLAIALLLATASAGESSPVEKAIFIGDSITQHGPSVEKLGWHGDYGMAASAQARDYVHVFTARLTEDQGSEPEIEIYARGGGTLPGQLKFLKDFKQSGAQIAVVQMGENDKLTGDGAAFLRDYERILEAIRSGNPDCRIFCFSVWAPPRGNKVKDDMIRQACQKYDATFVSLQTAYSNPINQAASEKRFSHPGVNWHPGDRGMQAMADALWAAYKGESPEQAESAHHAPDWSFSEDWSDGSENTWSPAPPRSGYAILKQDKPEGTVQYRIQLPVEKISGGEMLLRTRIKAEDISEKPNNWNGIKLMLRLQNAEGEWNYPQYHLPTGTYDWIDVNWGYLIPDNIVSAQLVIGLQNVTGTAYVDRIDISITQAK